MGVVMIAYGIHNHFSRNPAGLVDLLDALDFGVKCVATLDDLVNL